MRELDAAGTGLAEKSEAVVLIHSELKWEGGVVEGPFLIRREDFYYLFYSGECYGNHRYCVAVARAEHVLGPYLKSGAPVLSSGIGWAGPGHCVVLDAGSGHDVMIFHGADHLGGRLARGRLRCSLLCAPVVAVTGPRDGTDARGVLRAAAAAGDGEDVSAAGLAGLGRLLGLRWKALQVEGPGLHRASRATARGHRQPRSRRQRARALSTASLWEAGVRGAWYDEKPGGVPHEP